MAPPRPWVRAESNLHLLACVYSRFFGLGVYSRFFGLGFAPGPGRGSDPSSEFASGPTLQSYYQYSYDIKAFFRLDFSLVRCARAALRPSRLALGLAAGRAGAG